MSPAEYVIYIFGGVRATARALGRSPSSVSKWTKPKEHRGTGGQVPSSAMHEIMVIAKRDSLPITPSDLVNGRNQKLKKV